MMTANLVLLISSILLTTYLDATTPLVNNCSRLPTTTNKNATVGSNGFRIEVHSRNSDDISGYIADEVYEIKLSGIDKLQTFRGFSLIAVTENGSSAGTFHVKSDENHQCDDVIVENWSIPQISVRRKWKAPAKPIGCIWIKAMVVEYRDRWYIDDGLLTRKLCPIVPVKHLSSNDAPAQSSVSTDKCCACDEAKYEFEFRGIWSRQTHPVDYPIPEHLTHFDAIIGASHSNRYHMWTVGEYASAAMRQLVAGNSVRIEADMRSQAADIRTIIKAKAMHYPNVQSLTRGSFRVDRIHHLTSLVSRFGPSPDWFVGISSINLCDDNCQWISEHTFDLYPYDAGTNSGFTYMDNNPSHPPTPIHLIDEKNTDPQSPFYTGYSDRVRLMPLAKLTIRRSAVYASKCPNDTKTTTVDELDRDKPECAVGAWTRWSLCSATCGRGVRLRSRVYTFASKARMHKCRRTNAQREMCTAAIESCQPQQDNTQWQSIIKSAKHDDDEKYEKTSATTTVMTVMQTTTHALNRCQPSDWSQWSECNTNSCNSIRIRTRVLAFEDTNNQLCSNISLIDEQRCDDQQTTTLCHPVSTNNITTNAAPAVIVVPQLDILASVYRNIGDHDQPKYTRMQQPSSDPTTNHDSSLAVDRMLARIGVENIDYRLLVDSNTAAVPIGGNGVVCVSIDRLIRLLNLNDNNYVTATTTSTDNNHKHRSDMIDCVLSQWSQWSHCSKTCGRGGKKQRSRFVKTYPKNGGQSCSSKMIQEHRCAIRPCQSVVIDDLVFV